MVCHKMTVALLFARTQQDADDSALIDWKWYKTDELHTEYRRPDNNERVRFVPDGPDSLQNLRWNTKVYLGRDWYKRADAYKVRELTLPVKDGGAGFFELCDPQLPPPRRKRNNDVTLDQLRRTLERLGRE